MSDDDDPSGTDFKGATLADVEGVGPSLVVDRSADEDDPERLLAMLLAPPGADLDVAAAGAAALVGMLRQADQRADRERARLDAVLDRVVEPPARGAVPEGMTVYVRVRDVMHAHGWKRSKASEELRDAKRYAGHTHRDGEPLCVTVEEWTAWDQRGREEIKCRTASITGNVDRRATTSGDRRERRSGTAPTTTTGSASSEAPARRTRRQLGPYSHSGSVTPLIRPLRGRKP